LIRRRVHNQKPIQDFKDMSLATALSEYQKSHLLNLMAIEKHYQTFALPRQLPEVIQKAAIGIDPDGLMNNHQHRVGYATCTEGAIELAKHEIEIKRAKTFDEIFEITELVRNKIFGLGHLWSYDTALRIGFAKGVHPIKVYVQSGVRKGVRKVMNGKLPGGRSLPKHMFDPSLQKLKPYQLENFLCLYGKGYKSKGKRRNHE
jgi:hypothetical protein